MINAKRMKKNTIKSNFKSNAVVVDSTEVLDNLMKVQASLGKLSLQVFISDAHASIVDSLVKNDYLVKVDSIEKSDSVSLYLSGKVLTISWDI